MWQCYKFSFSSSWLLTSCFRIIELISLDFEDIRISNEAFIKLKLAEYAVSFVAAIQIGSSIV